MTSPLEYDIVKGLYSRAVKVPLQKLDTETNLGTYGRRGIKEIHIVLVNSCMNCYNLHSWGGGGGRFRNTYHIDQLHL